MALSPRSLPPVSAALSATSATVVLTPTFTPIDAPTPTLAVPPVPVTLAPDSTVAVVLFPASIRMSPVLAATPALTDAPMPSLSVSPSRAATVVLTATFAASAPATPTSPAPAPLVALATDSLFWPVTLTALTVSPRVLTTASSPTTATLVEMPAFNATAAPTPTLVLPGSTWLPSATALVSVSLALVTLSAPPVLAIVRPLPTFAVVVAIPTFTPTAAATATPPDCVLSSVFGASLVWSTLLLESFDAAATAAPAAVGELVVAAWAAFLVSGSLEAAAAAKPAEVGEVAAALSADFLPASLAASPCAVTFSSTLLPDDPSALAGGAPAASAFSPPFTLAVDEALLFATDLAPMAISPAAEMSRSISALTVSVALFSAIDAPTATLFPCVWPVAVDEVLLVWSALPVKAPESDSWLPVPRRAVAVLAATVIAATGVTDTSAPAAPPVAALLRVWVPLAVRSTSFAPLTMAALPISATVVFTATFMPTEAPTPTAAGSVAVAGLTLAPAVTLLSEVFSDSTRTSPPLALTVAPAPLLLVSPSMLAPLVFTSTLVANAPATPTLLAPAPLVAVVTKLFLPPAVGMTALTERPLLLTLAPSAMRA